MARILTLEMPEKEYDKLKHFLEGAVLEMRESRKQMREDQIKINRLKTESNWRTLGA